MTSTTLENVSTTLEPELYARFLRAGKVGQRWPKGKGYITRSDAARAAIKYFVEATEKHAAK